jgi:DsbC/DsbD-like thiol-disulfide interchange protein
MKIKSIICFLLACTLQAGAQIKDPAHWAYGLKKLSGNHYEVHLQCTVDEGWHIYAQQQGKDFIGTRTKIKLHLVPGLALVGKVAELGTKDTYTDPAVGISNVEYTGKVDFVQEVTLIPGIKSIRGSITYQTCTHKQCLPEQTINFSVPVK